MSTVHDLVTDWERLRQGPFMRTLALPRLTLARLAVTPQIFAERAAAVAAVGELERGWEGWSRRESRVTVTPTPENLDAFGAPLDGEWVSPDGRESRRLICDGRIWRLIGLVEMGESGSGEPVLRETTRLLARDGGFLAYAVYWGARGGEAAAPVRLAARFLGFEEG